MKISGNEFFFLFFLWSSNIERDISFVSSFQGKGSTSAFSESILRHAGYKTGLFTSPHLVNINERIRLNGKPISDEVFAKYFCEVWTRLEVSRGQGHTVARTTFSIL